MPYDSNPEVLTLLALRLKNFSSTETLAELFDLDPDETEARLASMQADGLATYREGRVSGWSLTPDGRVEAQRRLNEELAEAGCRDAVTPAYQQFLALNGEFLAVCTRWQVKDAEAGVLNDHDDPAYDAAVIAELEALDVRVQPICAELSTHLSRFNRLGSQFTAALDRVKAGEQEWFTKPTIDSYHTIWFELHETLLASLDIDRASEKAH